MPWLCFSVSFWKTLPLFLQSRWEGGEHNFSLLCSPCHWAAVWSKRLLCNTGVVYVWHAQRLNKRIDLFLCVSTPQWSGKGVSHQYNGWTNCIFPHRHEFAWKLLLCVGRTLLNISPKELYPIWEFALWAVSLLDEGSEIPQWKRTCLKFSDSGITNVTLQQILWSPELSV